MFWQKSAFCILQAVFQKRGQTTYNYQRQSYFVQFACAKYREKFVKTTQGVVKQMLEMEVEFLKIGNYTPIQSELNGNLR